MSQQYLCVKFEEDDNWVLPSGFAPVAKQLLQSELRSVRPFMSKPQQDVFVGRLETAMHEDTEWNALTKTARIDAHNHIKNMPPRPHRIIPCAIELGLKDKHRFSATVDGVLQFACNCFLRLRTRSELNDSLCDEIDYYTEWRKLNHLELLQLAYIRYRPIMTSSMLCRLLLTVGVLCLNREDLKKILCSKVMREGLLAATLSEFPTDNAFLIPYYGMLRQCSLYNAAWNDIIGLNHRRKLWSEESEPKKVYKEEERRRAFESFDEHFETAESCSPALDALVLSAQMAGWILAGTPARQYPFSVGLNMVNNEISAPWTENSQPAVMMLLSTDASSHLTGHRLSSESSAQRAHEKALEESERRNEKRQKNKERREQQHSKRVNHNLESEQRDSDEKDLNLTLDDSKDDILLGVSDSSKQPNGSGKNGMLYNSSDFSWESDGLSPLQRFINEPIQRTPLGSKQNLPNCAPKISNVSQLSKSPGHKDLQLIKKHDYAGNKENEVDRQGRLFKNELYTPINYLDNLKEKFWMREMEKSLFALKISLHYIALDFDNRPTIQNFHPEARSRSHYITHATFTKKHRENENTVRQTKSPIRRERIVSNGFRRAGQHRLGRKVEPMKKILSFLYGYLVAPSLVVLILIFYYLIFVHDDLFYHISNGLGIYAERDEV